MKRYIIPFFITLFLVSNAVESQSVGAVNKRARANQRALYRLNKKVTAMDKEQREMAGKLDNIADSLSGNRVYLMQRLSQNKAFSAMIVDSLASRLTGNLMAVERTVRTFFLICGFFIMCIIAMIVFLLIKYLQGAPANTKAIDSAVDMVTDIATLIRAASQMKQAPPQQTQPEAAQPAAPPPAEAPQPGAAPAADDPGFYIHIAEEIFRMNVRLDRMPAETKGVAALRNAVKRLEDELHMKGYTVVDLTGQLYDDGMTVMVRDFIPKDDIPRGQKKILRMLKPQIKYQGNIIAHGEIEVAMSTEDLALKTSPGINPVR